jgi:LAGLIDADG DNA endonuclease family
LEKPRTYTRTDKRYNITNESLYFRTKSLEELKPFADTFLNSEGKKMIPSNISELLTPRSLAFWIMDDG